MKSNSGELQTAQASKETLRFAIYIASLVRANSERYLCAYVMICFFDCLFRTSSTTFAEDFLLSMPRALYTERHKSCAGTFKAIGSFFMDCKERVALSSQSNVSYETGISQDRTSSSFVHLLRRKTSLETSSALATCSTRLEATSDSLSCAPLHWNPTAALRPHLEGDGSLIAESRPPQPTTFRDAQSMNVRHTNTYAPA